MSPFTSDFGQNRLTPLKNYGNILRHWGQLMSEEDFEYKFVVSFALVNGHLRSLPKGAE